MALDVLPPAEAISFLQTRTGRGDASGAKTLAEALGYLPLALDHAAAYCRRTQIRFTDYAAKASSLVATVPRGAGYPRSVAATFDLAITEAAAQSVEAEALMTYLAHCAPERIPMTLVEGAIDDETKRMQALASLVEVSLVKHDPFEDGTLAVTVHRLVQSVARTRAKANGLARGAVERIAARLATQYPDDGYSNPRSWPLCAQLTPHLLAQKASETTEILELPHWPHLLNRAGDYFHGRASYMQAASLFRDVLAIRERVFGPQHPSTATSLNNLAGLLRDQGDLEGARPLFERALAIHENARGPGHPDTATSLNNLALCCRPRVTWRGRNRFSSAR